MQKSRQRPYRLAVLPGGVRARKRRVLPSGRPWNVTSVAEHRPLCNNAAAFSVSIRTGPEGARAIAMLWMTACLPRSDDHREPRERTVDGHRLRCTAQERR
ncbi:hypothetical protein FM103_05505 [Corynebacterium xerosis]|nr:hypothetical protein FM103_05505 [Corynebacterium xerosis]